VQAFLRFTEQAGSSGGGESPTHGRTLEDEDCPPALLEAFSAALRKAELDPEGTAAKQVRRVLSFLPARAALPSARKGNDKTKVRPHPLGTYTRVLCV
jgi:hypothetical protein